MSCQYLDSAGKVLGEGETPSEAEGAALEWIADAHPGISEEDGYAILAELTMVQI